MLEVACFNVASAIVAAENGANRIELCENQTAGGTTPPSEWLIQVKDQVSIPVFIMIRPRGGDFLYTDVEFELMKAQLREFKSDADGFVFGLLNEQQTVDVTRTAELVQIAHPKPCTFHRAFDEVLDPSAALEDIISTGCKSILSSGGKPNALEGIAILEELVKKAGNRITIIPGGGVRAANLSHIRNTTGARVMHSSGSPSTGFLTSNANLPDVKEVKDMIRLLQ